MTYAYLIESCSSPVERQRMTRRLNPTPEAWAQLLAEASARNEKPRMRPDVERLMGLMG